jgi:hypothetical protein
MWRLIQLRVSSPSKVIDGHNLNCPYRRLVTESPSLKASDLKRGRGRGRGFVILTASSQCHSTTYSKRTRTFVDGDVGLNPSARGIKPRPHLAVDRSPSGLTSTSATYPALPYPVKPPSTRSNISITNIHRSHDQDVHPHPHH